MLFLTFKIGDDLYALDCGQIVEIVPMVHLREIPKAPGYLRGVFHYRGQVVPVIDACALSGFEPARQVLSTRIIMLSIRDTAGKDRLLGLAAERVIETIRAEKANIAEPGIAVEESPYLGRMLTTPRGLVQCIRPEVLLSQYIGKVLFPLEDEGDSPS